MAEWYYEWRCQSKSDDNAGNQDEKHRQEIAHHHKRLSVP